MQREPPIIMRRKGLIIVAVAVVAATLLSTALVRPSREIKVIVQGDLSQRIAARFDADDRVTEEVVTLPFERTFEANRFSFWLIPESDTGDSKINLQIKVNDAPWWPSNNNTLSLSQGVKGTLQTPGLFQFGRSQMGISGTSTEEIASIGYHECVD